MKRTLFLLFLLLCCPFFMPVAAQGHTLSKKESKAKMEALKKLSEKYGITYYLDDCDLAIVIKDDMYGVVTLDGRVVLPLEYYWLSYEYQAGLFIIAKEGEEGVGFANREGKIVLPFEFSSEYLGVGIDYVTDGMITAERKGKYGITDTTGRIVVPYIYDQRISLCNADKELMLVTSESFDTTWLLHFGGDTVMGPAYCIYTVAVGDKPMLEVGRIIGGDTLYGLYTLDGKEIMPCRYSQYFDFHNGKATVYRKGVGYGIIDRNGREVVPCGEKSLEGENQFLLESGLVVTYRDNRCGVYDLKGNEVIPPKYQYYYHDTRDRIALTDSTYAIFIFDTGGNLLEKFDMVFDEDDTYAFGGTPVGNNGLWGFLDRELHLAVPLRYTELHRIDYSHFSVLLDDGQRAIIDTTGKILVKGPFDYNIYQECGGIYHVISYYNTDSDREEMPYISGYVDIYGQTTFTSKELKRMEKWRKVKGEK